MPHKRKRRIDYDRIIWGDIPISIRRRLRELEPEEAERRAIPIVIPLMRRARAVRTRFADVERQKRRTAITRATSKFKIRIRKPSRRVRIPRLRPRGIGSAAGRVTRAAGGRIFNSRDRILGRMHS